jgi:hypothetical protein
LIPLFSIILRHWLRHYFHFHYLMFSFH